MIAGFVGGLVEKTEQDKSRSVCDLMSEVQRGRRWLVVDVRETKKIATRRSKYIDGG